MTQPLEYAITVTDEQDQALAWVAGGAENSAAYLQARNDEMLNSYVQGYNLATAPVPTKDVAVAYAYGTPEQQAQVVKVLGLDTPAAREAATAKGLGIAL